MHVSFLDNRKTVSTALLLFGLTVLTRIPFGSKILSHWDSVQFALATERYDIAVHQPHPPGYFLYVMLGKFLNLFTHDAHTSFVAISIVASGFAISGIFLLAERMYERTTALWASALALSSPLFWFFGEVGLTYIVEAFFSVFFGYLCWRIIRGEHRLLLVSALFLAFVGGVRQSTLVFLLPLWFYSMRAVSPKYIFISFVLLVVGVLLWFLPMLSLTGGYARYQAALAELWAYHFEPRIMHGGFGFFFERLKTLIQLIICALSLCLSYVAFYLFKGGFKDIKKDLLSKKGLFFAFWITPSVLYCLFVDINPGYTLLFMPVLLIVSTSFLKNVSERLHYSKMFGVLMSLAIIANGYFFFFGNLPVSLNVLKNESNYVMNFVDVVKDNFSPSTTVILSRDYTFHGARHFMYYLPEYRVYTMDDSVDIEGRKRKVFSGQHHNTFTSDAVHIPLKIKYFVSPFDDLCILNDMPKSDKNFAILTKNGKKVAFYGDIRLAAKVYSRMKFIFEK